MSNSGRWRRRTRSIAPSPATSLSPPGLREAQLPQWKFSQVLGELPPAAEARRGGAPCPQDDDADEISAIEFDGRGEYLAGGDNAGRVILFRRTDGDGDDARPRAELERADRAGAPPPRYSYATEFQSHEQEFDVLHSLEISESIKKVRWCARPNTSLLMLAANDRTVKLWKVSEHRAPKEGNGRPRRRWGTAALSAATKLPRGCSSADPDERRGKAAGDVVGDGYSAKCRRVLGPAHEFNIHSISNNWFQDRENRPQPSTFFSEIISCITDLKFTGDGEHLLTRDYMNLKLWDLRVETSPVATYKVHEFLRPKLSELYTDDYIFDRFGCCASKDGAYFATGSYSKTFRVFSRAAAQTSGTTLEASTNPYRIHLQAPARIPALLSSFSLGVHRKGQDGPRSDGKEEVSCNMASKVKHLAWHPAENFIVCAANSSLYMYHT